MTLFLLGLACMAIAVAVLLWSAERTPPAGEPWTMDLARLELEDEARLRATCPHTHERLLVDSCVLWFQCCKCKQYRCLGLVIEGSSNRRVRP